MVGQQRYCHSDHATKAIRKNPEHVHAQLFLLKPLANRSDLFEGLRIWQEERFRGLQGSYPVIFLSFAGIKQSSFNDAKIVINELIAEEFVRWKWLIKDDLFSDRERELFYQVRMDMDETASASSLHNLCDWLCRYYGKKPLIFLDEYDTPLQEAYVSGYWDEMTSYIRNLFNNTFKTNPFLGRAIMTGITKFNVDSILSDLNNLAVVTTSSSRYATCFGFTEEEVFNAMNEQGYGEDEKSKVKSWYDGFTFGNITDIYNPWSVTNYLKEGKLEPYWANSSGNALVSHLLQKGKPEVKTMFETLLQGGEVEISVDEQVVFNQLNKQENAVWSLLLATGYLKANEVYNNDDAEPIYKLSITNRETMMMFKKMVIGWFAEGEYFNQFVAAMFRGNVFEMNEYMNRVMQNIFSSFDTGKKASKREPERFYHGFVLGLLVNQADDYLFHSNRESGFGRYDVVLEPKDINKPAVIIEFKVMNPNAGEKKLNDTAVSALKQIEDKKYDTELLARGIPAGNIRKYGFAFRGKTCLIQMA